MSCEVVHLSVPRTKSPLEIICFGITFTVHSAPKLPSSDFIVIIAVPMPSAVIDACSLSSSTVAICSSLLLHMSIGFSPNTLSSSTRLLLISAWSPISNVISVLSIVSIGAFLIEISSINQYPSALVRFLT